MNEVDKLIERLAMQPHPEGGWYAETYRSEMMMETVRGPRPASTAIYFLLEEGQVSHLHRIASDELWHFYQGEALEIIEIDEVGQLIKTRLDAQQPQHLVKAGRWFGSKPLGAFALVGCTVAPGFDFADFELASLNHLPLAYRGELKALVLDPQS